jgi:hypothetical protein
MNDKKFEQRSENGKECVSCPKADFLILFELSLVNLFFLSERIRRSLFLNESQVSLGFWLWNRAARAKDVKLCTESLTLGWFPSDYLFSCQLKFSVLHSFLPPNSLDPKKSSLSFARTLYFSHEFRNPFQFEWHHLRRSSFLRIFRALQLLHSVSCNYESWRSPRLLFRSVVM